MKSQLPCFSSKFLIYPINWPKKNSKKISTHISTEFFFFGFWDNFFWKKEEIWACFNFNFWYNIIRDCVIKDLALICHTFVKNKFKPVKNWQCYFLKSLSFSLILRLQGFFFNFVIYQQFGELVPNSFSKSSQIHNRKIKFPVSKKWKKKLSQNNTASCFSFFLFLFLQPQKLIL